MFHRHRWEVLSALDVLETHNDYSPPAKRMTTIVLSRCEGCLKLKTETLDGYWANTLVPTAEPSTT